MLFPQYLLSKSGTKGPRRAERSHPIMPFLFESRADAVAAAIITHPSVAAGYRLGRISRTVQRDAQHHEPDPQQVPRGRDLSEHDGPDDRRARRQQR